MLNPHGILQVLTAVQEDPYHLLGEGGHRLSACDGRIDLGDAVVQVTRLRSSYSLATGVAHTLTSFGASTS